MHQIQFRSSFNVLFVSIQFMMTKRLKAIASAALLLDKEETSDDKDHKTHKKS